MSYDFSFRGVRKLFLMMLFVCLLFTLISCKPKPTEQETLQETETLNETQTEKNKDNETQTVAETTENETNESESYNAPTGNDLPIWWY